MKLQIKHIKDFISYGSNNHSVRNNIQLSAIFSFLAGCYFMFSYLINDSTERFVFDLILSILSFALFIVLLFMFISLKNMFISVLKTCLYNCIMIIDFSVLGFFFMLYIFIHSSINTIVLILCIIFYFCFSAIYFLLVIRKVHKGKYSEYIKPDYKTNHKMVLIIFLSFISVSFLLYLFIKFVPEYDIKMIAAEIVFLILNCIYSIPFSNFLKIYYIRKYNLTEFM